VLLNPRAIVYFVLKYDIGFIQQRIAMKKCVFVLTFFALMLISFGLFADKTDSTTFKPNGSPILKVFFNYHTGVFGKENLASFQVRRAYLGYQYNLTKELNIYLKLDIGSPDDVSEFSRIRRYAYFKNAGMRYKKGKITANVGIIDMLQFDLQEKIWGYRYIAKSYNDRYRFGPKADIGGNFIYAFNDIFSADFTISNGEGYTKLQTDNTFKGALGVTIKPINGMYIRGYVDLMKKSVSESSIATFVGYVHDRFSLGGEYNYKFNVDFVEGNDLYGYSVYGTYNIFKKWQVFARYDMLNSNLTDENDQPWHLISDGSSIIAGIQFTPIKYVKIALDYQDWVPFAENLDNAYFIFLNFEFKL